MDGISAFDVKRLYFAFSAVFVELKMCSDNTKINEENYLPTFEKYPVKSVASQYECLKQKQFGEVVIIIRLERNY